MVEGDTRMSDSWQSDIGLNEQALMGNYIVNIMVTKLAS